MPIKIRTYKEGQLPEWAQGKDGISHLLDGVRFQHTVNKQAADSGQHVPTIENLNLSEYEGWTQEQIFTELVCTVLVAYLAAMSNHLDNQTFGKIITPLPDALGDALAQAGIISAVPKEEFKPILSELKDKAEILEKRQAQAQHERKVEQAEHYFHEEEDDVLKDALEKLRAAGRRLTH